MVCRCQRQTRAQPEVLGCSRSVLTIKNLFSLALGQAMGFIESFLNLSGLHWPVPKFSTVCRRQHSLQVQVPYRSSQTGLHLLVDSTGIKFLSEGEWKCKKHGS